MIRSACLTKIVVALACTWLVGCGGSRDTKSWAADVAAPPSHNAPSPTFAPLPIKPIGAAQTANQGPPVVLAGGTGTLQMQLDALAARVAPDETVVGQGLASWLTSTQGEIAVGRTLTQLTGEAQRQALNLALRQAQGKPLAPQSAASAAITAAIARSAEALAGRFDDGPLEARLASVLKRPGAGAMLAVAFPREESLGMPPDMAIFFESGPQGKLRVAAAQSAAAKSGVEKVEAINAALAQGAQRLQRVADRMTTSTDLSRRYQAALRDPLFAALLGMKFLQAGKGAPELPGLIEQEATKVLQTSGQSYRVPAASEKALRPVLDAQDRLATEAEAARAQLSALADQIAPDDPVGARFRQVLVSPVVVLAAAVKAMESGDDALGKTILGDLLLAQGQRYHVTRSRRAEAEAFLDQFELLLGNRDLAGIAATAPVDQLLLVKAATELLQQNISLKMAGWVADTFTQANGKYRVKTAARGTLERMAAEAQTALTGNASPLSVPLTKGDYRRDGLKLFQASAFYDPHTELARRTYLNDFPQHYAARLWGVFEWDMYASTDERSFLQKLQARQAEIAQLAQTHQKLMVILSFTPSWLSSSTNEKVVEGHWKYRNAVRPRDWAGWERAVEDSVRFLSQFKQVEWYYEVWNEPDIQYWQEGSAEYLELYQHTVQAVKRAAPGAHVGGATTNQWQGKPAASRNAGPLNVDLIHFARDHKLPLDFVSWHAFGSDAGEMRQAAETYRAEWKKAGWDNAPELIVSEWNLGDAKGTERVPAAFAERMFTLNDIGVGMQFFSAWEEFNTGVPAEDGVGPWGMMTQQGRLKPEFYVFQLCDQLARSSAGLCMTSAGDSTVRVVSSRKTDGTYEMLVWRAGYAPGALDTVKALMDAGMSAQTLDKFDTFRNLDATLRTGKSIPGVSAAALQKARQGYLAKAKGEPIRLALADTGTVRILDTRQAGMAQGPCATVFVHEREIMVDVPYSDVVWLKVEARP